MKIYLPVLFTLLLLTAACNKTRKYANRLSGETWRVTSFSLGQLAQQPKNFPTLTFEDCDIYKDTCFGQWQLDSGSVDYLWQVNEKGKTFVLACVSLYDDLRETEEGGKNYEALRQCQYLSGYYTIDKMKRKTMEISSYSTAGYEGVEVELVLERVD